MPLAHYLILERRDFRLLLLVSFINNFFTNLLKLIKMKKVIFVIVAFSFSMCLVAQTDSTKNKMNRDENQQKETKVINH